MWIIEWTWRELDRVVYSDLRGKRTALRTLDLGNAASKNKTTGTASLEIQTLLDSDPRLLGCENFDFWKIAAITASIAGEQCQTADGSVCTDVKIGQRRGS